MSDIAGAPLIRRVVSGSLVMVAVVRMGRFLAECEAGEQCEMKKKSGECVESEGRECGESGEVKGDESSEVESRVEKQDR